METTRERVPVLAAAAYRAAPSVRRYMRRQIDLGYLHCDSWFAFRVAIISGSSNLTLDCDLVHRLDQDKGVVKIALGLVLTN